MIKLADFGAIVVGETSIENDAFLWACYGPCVASSQYWNEKHGAEEVVLCVNYDTRDGTVYEMQAWDGHANRQYRWIHPDYVDSYKAEATSRSVDGNQSIDDIKFIDLDVEADILEKATAIYNGFEYDTRIMVSIDLDDDLEITLYRLAHEADMTLNRYVEHILRQAIERHGDV